MGLTAKTPRAPRGHRGSWVRSMQNVLAVLLVATLAAPAVAGERRKTARKPEPPRMQVRQPAISPSHGFATDGSGGCDPPLLLPPQDLETPPREGRALRVLYATRPQYPGIARRQGREGPVTLRVTIDEAGKPRDVKVVTGSGTPALDEEARRCVREEWRFEPALKDGKPISATGLIIVRFRLMEAQ